MTKITSKVNPKTIWSIITLIIIVMGMLGSALIFVFYKEWQSNKIENKDYLMPIFGVLIYVIGFFYIKSYIKNSPKLELDKDKIVIKDKVYYWQNIKNIKITGKVGFGPFNYPMEATALIFNDNVQKYIFDDLYSNSWEIKSFIKQMIIEKKEKFEIKEFKIIKNEIDKENFEEFKGSPFFSFRGIILWSLIIFFVAMIIFSNSKISNMKGLIFLIPICIFWFAFNSYCMHYFELSKNYFVVKNHYFWWVKDIYKNSEIEVIVFECQQKQPNSLRVISKNFKRKIYLAGTLNDEKWLVMKTELERKNIEVRNEAI